MTIGNDAQHLDPAEMGGDPPCWAALVDDHRHTVGEDGPALTDAPPAASSRSSDEGCATDRPSEDHRALQPTDRTSAAMVTGGGATTAQDLSTPTQVHHVVIAFYREIMFDELLEPVFGEVAEVDWAEHIPKLIDYWCWILFGTKGYAGAVTRAHRHVHGLQPIGREHCDRWFFLWVRCVDERWSGPYAERAKTHASVLMAGMAKRLFGFLWVAPTHTSAPAPAG